MTKYFHAKAIVIRVLPDDIEGDKHQRFVIRSKKYSSVLIVHNIDIAKKVKNLQVGDKVEICGEYIWNSKGGLVHWTHKDPHRVHRTGWIKHKHIQYD